MRKNAWLILYFWAAAVEAQITDKVILDSVEITNNRITQFLSDMPKAIRIITADELKAVPAQTFAEALQYVAGVDIRRRGPFGVQSDISIRGGSFDQVLILINGVRMNDAQTGHHTLYLPVEMLDIERIEIIKGPAARIYGQNAFSGAVNIITKTTDKPGFLVNANYGSFSTKQLGANGNLVSKNGKISQKLALNYTESDGYDYNRDFKTGSFFYQGKALINDLTTLEWFSGAGSRKFGANGFYALPTHKDQYEEVSTSVSSVSLKKVFDQLTLTGRVSHRWNDDYYEFVRTKPEIFSNKTTGIRYTSDVNASYYNKLGVLGLGFEYSFETLKSTGLGNHERGILSGFVEQKFTTKENKLNFIPGLFINKFSDRDVQIFPGLDVNYKITKALKIYSGLNYANRIPTYTDLYYRSRVEKGNAALLSESVRSIEAGIERSDRYTVLKASVYRNYTQNLIDWTKKTNADTFWIARNYVASDFTGIELSGTFDFSEIMQLKNILELDLNASFISAESANSDNQYITRYQFNHIGNQFIASLKSGWVSDKLLFNINYRLIDRVGEDIDPVTKKNLLDVNLWDLSAMYKIGKISLKYTVNNLSDQSYKEINNVLMPGRWHQIQLIINI
jgi:vitamin B12 transporter